MIHHKPSQIPYNCEMPSYMAIKRFALVTAIAFSVSYALFIMAVANGGDRYPGAEQTRPHKLHRTKLNLYDPSTPARPLNLCPNVRAHSRHAIVTYLGINQAVDSKVDWYTLSACKLAQSILMFSRGIDLVMLLAVEKGYIVQERSLDAITNAGWQICMVDFIGANHTVTNRFHDAKIYTKLHAWRMTEYEALASVDADALALRDPSGLFTQVWPDMQSKGYSFAMALDYPRPDHQPTFLQRLIGRCTPPREHWQAQTANDFNAGVFLLQPSLATYEALLRTVNLPTYDVVMCEQGLLNSFFRNRTYTLPFKYNANLVTKACVPELYASHQSDTVFLHFTVAKPWMTSLYSREWMWSCPWWHLQEECATWDLFSLPAFAPAHDVTVVTALYDIQRPDRPFASYLEWIKLTFQIKYPMVIFCHQQHAAAVRRARRGLLHITTLILEEAFPFHNTTARVEQIIRGRHHAKTPEWTRPAYIPLVFSKFPWITRSIRLDPYGTRNFYWVDAGLGKFFQQGQMAQQHLRVFDLLTENKVSLQLSLRESLPPRIPRVESNDSPFIGGLFGGSRHAMLALSNLTIAYYFDELLARGYVDNEQVAFGILYHRHPELFEVLTAHDFPKGTCNVACI